MSWSDASENFKKNLKNRLGDKAYREFLRHVTNECSLDVINDWWRWSMLTKDKDIHQELFRMVSDYDPVTWSDEPRSKAMTETETKAAFVDDNQLYFAQELAGIYDDGASFNYDNPSGRDPSGKDPSGRDHFSENLYPFVNEYIITSNDPCAPKPSPHQDSYDQELPHQNLFCEQDGLSCPQSLSFTQESSVIYLQITQTTL
jgi:hypothetical protein